jgi:membrane-bound lytic murein transglycosylase MltF
MLSESVHRLAVAALPVAVLAVSSPLAGRQDPAPNRLELPPAGFERLGDFDAMRKRRLVRVLVVVNQTNFFVDRGTPRGITYEAFQAFEDHINRKYRTGNLPIHVAYIPVLRSDLAAALLDGRGDVAAANITVTPERRQQVDFSDPTVRDISEIVVGGPASESIAAATELSGREVFVRNRSISHESLERLNADLEGRGRPPVRLRFAPDTFEDEDLLEMVNAGLVPYVVVPDALARFWSAVLPDLKLCPEATLRTDADIAWAIRKNSPLLKAELDAFLATYPVGSATRNVLLQKYLKSTRFVKNAASRKELDKFHQTVALFRKYSDRYDMDPLLMAAQGYQESRLNHQARSRAGAIGIMQLLPATGREQKVGDITQLEPNIHAGVKYMRFIVDRYFAGEPMDRLNKGLFAFAAYNAGPARIRGLRKETASRGLDPNTWFDNVEIVASEKIGRETVTYVANIYKYYVAYKLVEDAEAERAKARKAVSP